MASQPPAPPAGLDTTSTDSSGGATAIAAAVVAATARPVDVLLVFSHECAHAACNDRRCGLCSHARRRRCRRSVKRAYAVGDAVVAECGATVHVELVLGRSHVCVRRPPPGTRVHLYLVQADAHEAAMALGRGAAPLCAGGSEPRFPEALMGHTLGLDGVDPAGGLEDGRGGGPQLPQHGEAAAAAAAPHAAPPALPAAGAAGINAPHLLSDAARTALARLVAAPNAGVPPHQALVAPDVVRFDDTLAVAAASLGDVRFRVPSAQTVLAHGGDGGGGGGVAGPSTGPPPSSRPRHRLVRLVVALVLDDDVATPFPNASPTISDPFVVHAQRPRQAKADVALTTDDVGTLPYVGANSVTRLAQLEHAAANVGIDLRLPPRVVRVRTVADLQALVAAVATDQALDRDVRTTLMLTVAQWDNVKEAAMRAVVPDSRLRVWYSTDRMRGLVFTCVDGELNLTHPAAVLAAIVSEPPPGTRTLPCPDNDVAFIIGHTVELYADVFDRAEADALRDAAVAGWCEAGHPGWAVLSANGRAVDGADAVDRLVAYVRARRVGGVNVLEVQEVGR